MPEFQIDQTTLTADVDPRSGGDGFMVKSVPRPYTVEWCSERPLGSLMSELIAEAVHPIVMIDRVVRALHFPEPDAFGGAAVWEVDSSETFKSIDGALELCAFLDAQGASKASMLFVIGGGIVQDVGGFGACLYKRGIPWTYLPTTFLAQADSGMGSKAGLNYRGAKNILAIFSAPRRLIIHTGFLKTLGEEDVFSGLGECFRLCNTGGWEFARFFDEGLERYFNDGRTTLDELLVASLAVKRAVIEKDEFELHERRAMNYGHSLGHAFEALTSNEIPHGTAVVLGMLVENEISKAVGLMSDDDAERIASIAKRLVLPCFVERLGRMDYTSLLSVLAKDKKSEGKSLKLALLERPGRIVFKAFELNEDGRQQIERAVAAVIRRLSGEMQEAS